MKCCIALVLDIWENLCIFKMEFYITRLRKYETLVLKFVIQKGSYKVRLVHFTDEEMKAGVVKVLDKGDRGSQRQRQNQSLKFLNLSLRNFILDIISAEYANELEFQLQGFITEMASKALF